MRKILGCFFLLVIAFSVSGQSKMLKAKADKGDVEAMVEVAKAYEVKGNRGAAAKYYQKAADMGHAEAQFQMGVYCKNQWIKVDSCYIKMAKWWEKAASRGHAEAQFQLARLYSHKETLGVKGYKKDEAKAKELFEKAAALGHPEAQKEADKIQDESDNVMRGLIMLMLLSPVVLLFLYFKRRSAFYAVIFFVLSFLLAVCLFAFGVGTGVFYPLVKGCSNWIVGIAAIGVAYLAIMFIGKVPVKAKYQTWKTLRYEAICMLLISGFASVEESGNFNGLLEFFGVYPDAEGTINFLSFFFLFFAIHGCLSSFYRVEKRSNAWRYMFSNLLFLVSVFFIGFGLGGIVATIMLFVLVAGGLVSGVNGKFSSSSTSESEPQGEQEEVYKVTDEHGFERTLKDEGWGKFKDDQGHMWKRTDSFGTVERDD